MRRLSNNRSFKSTVTASGTGSPDRIVTINRAQPLAASWCTNVDDNGSSNCASSTTTTRFSSRSRVLCAAASITAGSCAASTVTDRKNAPNGMAHPVWVPSTYRTVDPPDSSVSASARASVDLPTPLSPTNATPWNSASSSSAANAWRNSSSRATIGQPLPVCTSRRTSTARSFRRRYPDFPHRSDQMLNQALDRALTKTCSRRPDAKLGENAIEVSSTVHTETESRAAIWLLISPPRPASRSRVYGRSLAAAVRATRRSYSGSACAQVRPIMSQQPAHGVHSIHGAVLVDGLDRHHRDVLVVG